MAATSLTLNYDAMLTSTMFNYRKTLADNISISNSIYWFLKNKMKDGLEEVSELGDRMTIPILYENGTADVYSGYDVLPTAPIEGITNAFWPWFQAATPIAISELERKKNTGEARVISLLDTKVKQAEQGMKEIISKMIMQGAGLTTPTVDSITSRYQSPNNLNYGPEPLFSCIRVNPTTSTTVGGVNQSTESWWRNQAMDLSSGVTTYAQFLGKMRHLHNLLIERDMDGPNIYLSDMTTYELYETALAAYHQNPSYQKADIPFEAVQFRNRPWIFDSFMPQDVAAGLVTDGSNPTGTVVGLNLKNWKLKIHSGTNFSTTEFQKPYNQDAKVAHILLLAGIGMMNRRTQGIAFGIPTTLS